MDCSLHGSETWTLRKEIDLKRWRKTEKIKRIDKVPDEDVPDKKSGRGRINADYQLQ